MNSGIYEIKNVENGKRYIGSTKNFEKRKNQHFNNLRKGKHKNLRLQYAFNKYGESKFNFNIIEEIKYSLDITDREQYYIDFLDSKNHGYNIADAYVSEHTERSLKTLSELASLRIGDKNPFFGRHHSEETLQILREKNKGKLPTNCRKYVIDGIEYESLTAAERTTGISKPLLIFRAKSKNKRFIGHFYVDVPK